MFILDSYLCIKWRNIQGYFLLYFFHNSVCVCVNNQYLDLSGYFILFLLMSEVYNLFS